LVALNSFKPPSGWGRQLSADGHRVAQTFRLEAAILSRMRSEVTSRSNWAKDRSTLSVSRPIEVVVLNCWVTETNDTPCASNSSTSLAKSASDRVRRSQALDHENRKTPIIKPAANAQRPNVQAETTRTRLRRSCGISWDRSVIAAAPCGGRQPVTGELAILANTVTLLLTGAQKKAIVRCRRGSPR
jgi:hypothetical protein